MSVLAGHRSTATERIFRNVDLLEPGDRITLQVLGETLTYEVVVQYEIQPSEADRLAVIEGQDTLTLLTCTPYLTNWRRLIVDTVRVDGLERPEVTPTSTVPSTQITSAEPTPSPSGTTLETPTRTPTPTATPTRVPVAAAAGSTSEHPSFARRKGLMFGITAVVVLVLIGAVVQLLRTFKKPRR